MKQLGVNALWLQPIHPRGTDGRQIDPTTNRPFELGSPYAVKNYFAVMPLMASGFNPGSSPAANDTPQGRAAALTEFQNFVKAANAQLPNLSAAIARGDLGVLRGWLGEKVHQLGYRLPAEERVRAATGHGLTEVDFVDYLRTKYGELTGAPL